MFSKIITFVGYFYVIGDYDKSNLSLIRQGMVVATTVKPRSYKTYLNHTQYESYIKKKLKLSFRAKIFFSCFFCLFFFLFFFGHNCMRNFAYYLYNFLLHFQAKWLCKPPDFSREIGVWRFYLIKWPTIFWLFLDNNEMFEGWGLLGLGSGGV